MSNTSHRNLLLEAKAQQQIRLQEAAASSEQLASAIEALRKANSLNSSGQSSAVLDKITTIHEQDKEIDRQLNEDIAPSHMKARREKEKLVAFVKRIQRVLAVDKATHTSYVDILQRRLELADQEIRMLENTLELAKGKNI